MRFLAGKNKKVEVMGYKIIDTITNRGYYLTRLNIRRFCFALHLAEEIDVCSFGRNLEILTSIMHIITNRSIPEAESKARVTLSQLKCLQYIHSHDKVLIGYIAKNRGISYPAATKTISRLADKGLVVREQDPADRRNIAVRLTDNGRLVATNILPDRIRRLKMLMDEMPLNKRQAMQTGIDAFLEVALKDRELLEQVCLHCGRDHEETCLLYGIKQKCGTL
jgi:DNA-binding MarR family transcriptional regulator